MRILGRANSEELRWPRLAVVGRRLPCPVGCPPLGGQSVPQVLPLVEGIQIPCSESISLGDIGFVVCSSSADSQLP